MAGGGGDGGRREAGCRVETAPYLGVGLCRCQTLVRSLPKGGEVPALPQARLDSLTHSKITRARIRVTKVTILVRGRRASLGVEREAVLCAASLLDMRSAGRF